MQNCSGLSPIAYEVNGSIVALGCATSEDAETDIGQQGLAEDEPAPRAASQDEAEAPETPASPPETSGGRSRSGSDSTPSRLSGGFPNTPSPVFEQGDRGQPEWPEVPEGLVFPDDAWMQQSFHYYAEQALAGVDMLGMDGLPPPAFNFDLYTDASMLWGFDETGWEPDEYYEPGWDVPCLDDVTCWEEASPQVHDAAVQRLLDALLEGNGEYSKRPRKLKNIRRPIKDLDVEVTTSPPSDDVSTVSQSASSGEFAPSADVDAPTPRGEADDGVPEDDSRSSGDGRQLRENQGLLHFGGTTVMVRNIPNKYTREMLVEQLKEHFLGEFDFIYLPIDFRNCCNVGYGFVNFITSEACSRFVHEFNGVEVHKCLPGLNSRKVVEVTPARVQGLEANLKRLRISPVMHTLLEHPEWMPLVFDKDCRELPFPMPEQAASEATQRSRGGGKESRSSRQAAQQTSGRSARAWRRRPASKYYY